MGRLVTKVLVKATIEALLKAGAPTPDKKDCARVAASITYYRSPNRRRRREAKTLVG